MFLGHSSKHTQENIFLIKIPKILRVFAQDVPYGMKAYVCNDQSNACVAGTTRSVNASCSDVITVPLFFSPPPPLPPTPSQSYNPRSPSPRYI